MKRDVCALALLLCSCDRLFLPREPITVADAGVDVPDAYVCHGTGVLRLCLTSAPALELQLAGTINTDSDPRCITAEPNVDDVCVLYARTITVANVTHGIGSRPLALVADESITVTARLSVASVRADAIIGAGARPSCEPAAGIGTFTSPNGGGGAGGTHGFAGGPGGFGGNGNAKGGDARQPVASALIRGGCPGANGGSLVQPAPSGGAGGGALVLIARDTITVDTAGSITASGAGGGGGRSSNGGGSGGGGGGAGGLIVLDAEQVVVRGDVFARGGGGGGGGGTTNGNGGLEAQSTRTGAGGGTAGTNGGSGAPGCGGPNGREGGFPVPATAPLGGAGGGGGCGVIRVFGVRDLADSLSPAPT